MRKVLLCLFSLLFVLPALSETFQNPRHIPLPLNGALAGTADFNGDGRPDFFYYGAAYPASGEANIVLAQSADGSYSNPIPVSLAGATQSCRAYDLNGDGLADLLCISPQGTGSTTEFVNAFIGNGDGTFQPPIRSNTPAMYTPSSLYPVVSGDINGDGHADLILFDLDQGIIFPMLGDGAGNFTLSKTFTAITSNLPAPPFAVLRDVNGDGHPDLLFSGPLQVFLGNGDGTFTRGFTGPYDEECLFRDFDGDQHVDAECLDVSGITTYQNVILHGNPDGTFNPTPIATPNLPSFARPVAALDVNGDGLVDLVGIGAGGTVIYLGKPGLQFALPAGYAFYSAAASNFAFTDTLIADYNGDGVLDLAIAANDGIYIAYGRGDGSFLAPQPDTSGTTIGGLVVADFDGDTIPDVITSGSASLQFNHGNGDGSFAVASALQTKDLAVGSASSLLFAGDFDGDGHLDLIATNQTATNPSQPHIFFGGGNGTFADPVTASSNFTFVPLAGATVADLNGDGRADIVSPFSNYPSTSLWVMLSNGDGSFSSQSIATFSSSFFSSVADINGDGKPDIIVTTAGAIQIYLGKGDGTFSPLSAAPIAPVVGNNHYAPGPAVTGDFDGDGKMDFALVPYLGSTGGVSVYYGRGDGTFSAPVSVTTSFAVGSVTAHDLNGDGLDDLVLSASSIYQTPIISIRHGMANRTFDTGTGLVAGDGSLALSIADLNLDGRPDLVFSNSFSAFQTGNTFVALLNQASTTTTLTADASSIQYGQRAAFTANVMLAADSSKAPPASATITLTGLPGSPVTFPITLAYTAAGALPTGTATYATTNLLPGTYTVVASLSGNCCLVPSSSAAATLVVTPAATTTTVALSPVPPLTWQRAILNVQVNSQTTVPTGTVTFFDQGTQMGTATISAGAATLTTSPLTAGAHSITAIYAGTSNFLTSTSQPLNLTVFNSGYLLTAASTSLSFAAGAAVGNTDILTLSPVKGFSGNVSLNCSVTSTDGGTLPTCSLSPSSITLADTPSNSTLTVSSVSNSALRIPPHLASDGWISACLLAFIPALLRRRRRWSWAALVALLVLPTIMLLSGCSGSAAAPATATASVKTYIITVSASSTMPGSAPAPITITVRMN